MPSESYLIECLEKFSELPDILTLELNHPRYLQILDNISDRYGLDLSFTIVLLVVNEINYDNLADYLAQRFDLDEQIAKKIATEIKELYLQPVIDRLSFLNADPQKTKPTIEEEKAIIIDLFKENLLVELDNYRPTIEAVNQRIFAWLGRELDAKKKIENALLQNQEIVTTFSPDINKETVTGNISNWLRCFAAEKGVDNFSSLSISEFLGTSKNTIKLSSQEKLLLRNVLNTYRNIKFFPDSMPNDKGEDWAIIPLPLEKDDNLGQDFSQTVAATKQTSLEPTPNIDPTITNKISQLRLMLGRYGENTLEGEAIKEEIAKLEKR